MTAARGPRIGVALCTRDGERFVAEQLRSILAQSPAPDALVISDDDSADGTLAIARAEIERADAGPELVWIENRPPLGVTKNFEGAVRAASAASAELIALSDQDDVWHAGRLARATAVFAADPEALLLFTDARIVDAAGVPRGPGLFETLGVSEPELGLVESGNAFAALLRRNIVTGATVVFRRELLDLALPFPETWVHDEWLAIVAAVHGGVRVLRAQTIDYRQHGGNEIGVVEPTLAYRVRRMLEPRGTRNTQLAAKFAELEAWGRRTGVAPSTAASLAAKAGFERARAALPDARLARLPAVIRLAARGLYPRYASQGWLDVLRDLLQPK
ncbi:MAG TPA: glycosyltransferase family 2 protein [Gryllotalpicola sp.]